MSEYDPRRVSQKAKTTASSFIAFPSLDTSLSTNISRNHAIETFTAENGKLWLRDFLKDDIPEARIMIFGFSVRLNEDNLEMEEISERFLHALKGRRDTRPRPIFLLGYSLGGIVIKHILTHASLRTDFDSIQRDTYCTVFLGTPHRGANGVKLAQTVKTVASLLTTAKNKSTFLESLSRSSFYARAIQENYRQILDRFCIITVYETLKTSNQMVVDRDSATLHQPGRHESKVAVWRDHLQLSKYERREDPDYAAIMDTLKPRVEEALHAISVRERLGDFTVPLTDPSLKILTINTMKELDQEDFVGRAKELDDLEQRLMANINQRQPTKHYRFALYGPAGAGKSSIAVKICYRVFRRVKVSIFWLSAESNDSIRSGLVEFARQVGLQPPPGKSSDYDAICESMHSWLEGPRSGAWVLVLDGMDNCELEARKFLPVRNGNIIVTTRTENVRGDLVPLRQCVAIAEMTSVDALDLFRISSEVDLSDSDVLEEAEELLVKLDHMALPITQAAAYIRRKRISISEYMRLFDQSQQDKEEALSHPTVYYPEPAKRSSMITMTTWLVTFKGIGSESPESLELLGQMALLDPTNIRKDLLVPSLDGDHRRDFYRRMEPLLAYSLVKALRYEGYSMHALVALCTRTHMDQDKRLSNTMNSTIDMVVDSMPDDETDEVVINFTTHALSLSEHATKVKTSTAALGTLEYRLGKYMFHHGNYKHAMLHGVRAYEVRLATQSNSADDFPLIMESVARACWNLQNLEEMKMWLLRALSEKQTRYGPEDSRTLDTVGRIATYYHMVGLYAESLHWHQKDLEGRQRIHGEGHDSTMKIINNKAGVHFLLGEYETAFEMHKRVWSRIRKTPSFPASMLRDVTLSMARDMLKLKQCSNARTLLQELLHEDEQMFGPEHPGAARLTEDVGETYCDEEEYDLSLDWYLESLKRYKAAGLAIGQILSNIGEVCKRKQDYNESYRYFMLSLKWKSREMGKENTSTILTMRNIADLFVTQDVFAIGLHWYRKALAAGQRTIQRKKDPIHFNHWHLIAAVLGKLSRFPDALDACERALVGKEQLYEKTNKMYMITYDLSTQLKQQYDSILADWDRENSWQELRSLLD
ncbi:TPR-like protein [Plenodomus tracheiphilus IPT5]|uniref:TPR-like protein n=1 Tax=Plenodomus tracheiphilus IPT5 TaxID=1408161 RepID=A0A6A7BA15_9PLEO|nr:TPR-like protein [Plenodomus tracheiphilus IPT5]